MGARCKGVRHFLQLPFSLAAPANFSPVTQSKRSSESFEAETLSVGGLL